MLAERNVTFACSEIIVSVRDGETGRELCGERHPRPGRLGEKTVEPVEATKAIHAHHTKQREIGVLISVVWCDARGS